MEFQLCNFCDLNLNDILIVCFGGMGYGFSKLFG